MDQGLGSPSNAPPGSIDKSRVFDVRPLRRLVPVFPNSPGTSSISTPHPMPFTCISPSGPFPPGIQPFYPFSGSNNSNSNITFGATMVQSPIPLNSFQTPMAHTNGATGAKNEPGPIGMEGDGYNMLNISRRNTNSSKRKNRTKERAVNGSDFDFEALANSFMALFKLNDFESFKNSHSGKEVVDTVLLVFDLIRRKLTQLEESKNIVLGHVRQPGPKAGALLTSKGVRANSSKRIGHVPGIEIGDIFFFRMELCIVGLHAPSMAGIDYMTVKLSMDEEPVAVSIVSSGGYDNAEGSDGDMLIYSGQGGVQRKDGQMFDQKLERGNLALEKSLHRENDVRVVRGIKDVSALPGSTGKIYVYDGLYRIRESWVEKNTLGCSVFKYKLVRAPGQPEAFTLWKSIQRWKDGSAVRSGVILSDLSSGREALPVGLINEIDGEKGPAYFAYVRGLSYKQPFYTSKSSPGGCGCKGGCEPGNTDCPCNRKNDGLVSYSSLGVLLTEKSLVYECGPACLCPPSCRNRVTQAGLKARLEVFKTMNRGWGLRSWDPIRAGGFICEYAGDVISPDESADSSNDYSNSDYIFDATRYYEALGKMDPGRVDPSSGYGRSPFPLVVSAKSNGNVARFMNHSCHPNVMWVPILRESDEQSYMHVAFFAVKHIPPMQELTFDYGIVRNDKGERRKKKCLCGSVKCRGHFFG